MTKKHIIKTENTHISPPEHNRHAVTALREAKERQKQMDLKAKTRPPEKNGPDGPDPARYGDWEVKGIASDF